MSENKKHIMLNDQIVTKNIEKILNTKNPGKDQIDTSSLTKKDADILRRKNKAKYKDQFNKYKELYRSMSQEYKQWSSKILIEHPGDYDDNNYKSASLISHILNYEPHPEHHIPQYLKNAVEKVETISILRKKYLAGLYKQLTQSERVQYKSILNLWVQEDSLTWEPNASSFFKLEAPAMANIKALKTYLTVDRLWLALIAEREAPTSSLYPLSNIAQADKLYKEVSLFIKDHIAESTDNTKEDNSLAARILLATVMNLNLIEHLELERFVRITKKSLGQLIRFLKSKGVEFIPAHLPKEEFANWLAYYFGNSNIDCGEIIKPVEAQHLERILKHSMNILTSSNPEGNIVEYFSFKRNLGALAMTWNFCQKEKHASNVPGIRDYELINGREISMGVYRNGSVALFHMRQIDSLFGSMQFEELSLVHLEMHLYLNLLKKKERVAFLESTFRNANLKKWLDINNLFKDLI